MPGVSGEDGFEKGKMSIMDVHPMNIVEDG